MERSAVDRVVYLHGFRSSPASAKGRELAAAAAEWNADFSAPDLNLSPREADALVGSLLSPLSAQARRCTLLVGSSLGGFYALRAARAYGCPTAVVNPCLMPWDFVPQQVGLQTIFGTNRTIMVKPGFADEFRELAAEMPPMRWCCFQRQTRRLTGILRIERCATLPKCFPPRMIIECSALLSACPPYADFLCGARLCLHSTRDSAK